MHFSETEIDVNVLSITPDFYSKLNKNSQLIQLPNGAALYNIYIILNSHFYNLPDGTNIVIYIISINNDAIIHVIHLYT